MWAVPVCVIGGGTSCASSSESTSVSAPYGLAEAAAAALRSSTAVEHCGPMGG